MLQKLEYKLTQADIDYERFGIGKKNSGFFQPHHTDIVREPFPFDLETDINSTLIETTIRDKRSSYRISKGLKPWFKKYRGELKIDGKVVFKAIEPMKKYRLEIVK